MKRHVRASAWAIPLVWGSLALLAADSLPPSGREGYRERYSILSERNIFVRNRARPPVTRTPPSFGPPRQPEQSFVLRGIVLENDEYRAYFENTDNSTMMRLQVGDAIARGRIAGIEMDAVAYEQGGSVTWVVIGNALTGQVAGPSPPRMAASVPQGPAAGPSTQPTGMPPIDPNDPNLSLEERMKLRRMQELNR